MVITVVIASLSIPVASAANIYVNSTGNDVTGTGTITNPYKTINWGITKAANGDTVNVGTGTFGTYTNTTSKDYNITISKNLNITGVSKDQTIINPAGNGWVLNIATGFTVTLSNLTITNGNADDSGTQTTNASGGAITNQGTLIVNNCNFTSNSASATASSTSFLGSSSTAYAYGGAIYNTGSLTITNSTFTGNRATANANTGVVLGGSTANAYAEGGAIYSTGTLTVTNSIFVNNTATASATATALFGSTTARSYAFGGAIYNAGPLNVSGSNLENNRVTATSNPDTTSDAYGGAIYNIGGTVDDREIHFNRIIGNTNYDIYSASGAVDAENNWWGSNTSPSSRVSGTVDVNPWLVLTITANPGSIRRGSTSNLSADLTHNSNNQDTSSQGNVPDGILAAFSILIGSTVGTVNPTSANTINGRANSTFTAGNTLGIARIATTVDGVTVYTDIIIGNIANLGITNTIAYDDSVSYLHDTGLFHIIVRNNGPDDATGVKVNITIPSGFQLLAVNPIVGTYDTFTNIWTIGNISYNGTACLDLVLKVIQSGTSLTVTANVTGNENDTDLSNNTASKTVNILRAADLQVTQTISNITPNQGNSITSTITVKNNGPDSANNISLYYKPPVGLNIASITPSIGSYNSITGLWTINSLAWNGTATLTIIATVTAPSGTIIKNTARVAGENEIDKSYNSANTANIRVGGASYTPKIDLEIYNYYYNFDQDSVGGTVQRKLKDTAMFYVDLKNYGPDDATGVKVTFIIPAGYQLLAVNPKTGTFDALTNTWNVGTLCSGGWAYCDYIVTVIQSNTVLNSTTNATAAETDTNSSNNGASAIVQVPAAADIQVNQTVNDTHPITGSTVNYTVTVTNNGPDTANNIIIYYKPPAGLNVVNITPSTGSYNSTTGEWTINSLGVNGSATLSVTATVTASSGTIIKSMATRIRETETDPNWTDISKIAYLQVQ